MSVLGKREGNLVAEVALAKNWGRGGRFGGMPCAHRKLGPWSSAQPMPCAHRKLWPLSSASPMAWSTREHSSGDFDTTMAWPTPGREQRRFLWFNAMVHNRTPAAGIPIPGWHCPHGDPCRDDFDTRMAWRMSAEAITTVALVSFIEAVRSASVHRPCQQHGAGRGNVGAVRCWRTALAGDGGSEVVGGDGEGGGLVWSSAGFLHA